MADKGGRKHPGRHKYNGYGRGVQPYDRRPQSLPCLLSMRTPLRMAFIPGFPLSCIRFLAGISRRGGRPFQLLLEGN